MLMLCPTSSLDNCEKQDCETDTATSFESTSLSISVRACVPIGSPITLLCAYCPKNTILSFEVKRSFVVSYLPRSKRKILVEIS
mmetsp:Transcript_53964/g.131045  ORF Transcript_53964/g.131045 Transcript_53964/m.131045 type:complete len:84 (-) Transcript_53964:3102-3353(-)